MESNEKESNEFKRKVRKVWLPVLLCILIMINLLIVPKILTNQSSSFQPISVESSNTLLPSPSIPIQTIPPEQSVPKSEEKPITNEPQQEEPKKTEPVPPVVNKHKSNKNKQRVVPSVHSQSRNFRFALFFVVLLIAGLIFVMIVYKNERNFEYSKARSGNLDLSSSQRGNRKNNQQSNNGYYQLPDKPYEYYDNI